MSELASLRLGFAFSAGVATFFAPCAYPLLPGYVAFYLGDAASDASTGVRLRRAGLVAALISGGMLIAYAALAVLVAVVGTEPLLNLAVLELVVGAGLVVLGVAVAAGRCSVAAVHVRLPARRRAKSGFLLFGVVYAAAAAGCTAPVFVGLASVGRLSARAPIQQLAEAQLARRRQRPCDAAIEGRGSCSVVHGSPLSFSYRHRCARR